jgi:hypothetical protein
MSTPRPAAPRAATVAAVAALLLATACGDGDGDGAGAPAGGRPDGGGSAAADGDRARDLTAFFEDGMIVGLPGEVPTGRFPANATREQLEALKRLNAYRAELRLPPVDMAPELNVAAQSHAACRAERAHEWGARPLHEEDAEWGAPCSGATPADRVAAAGVAATTVFEANTVTPSAPSVAVDRWMVGLYERLPVVFRTSHACGFGFAQPPAGGARAAVLNALRRNVVRDSEEPVVWPRNGASEVPTLWGGQSEPAPPAPPGDWPSGPVLTMTWAGHAFRAVAHELFDGQGRSVPHTFLDAENDPRLVGWDTVALYADEPLQAGTSYLVVLELETGAGGRTRKTVDWAFQTRGTAG